MDTLAVKMWKIILLTSWLVLTTQGDMEDFAMPRYSSPLSKAVTDVIKNFYVHDSSTVNIIYNSLEDQAPVLDIVNEVLYHIEGETTVQLDSLENPNAGLKNGKKFHNIVFLDSMESFERIFATLDSDHFNNQGIYLFVLIKQTENAHELMAWIFERLWSRFITNANVLWQPMDVGVEALMYTYYPYTTIYCGKAFPVKLNQYVNDEWLNDAEYFPRKMENLYRCPLRVATFASAPFMIIRDTGELDGIDGILLRVLSQRMNFNVKLLLSNDQWGSIYENGSATGAVGMVIEEKANMTLGFLSSTAIRDTFMSPSYVYYTTKLIWMIPPGRVVSPFGKLLKPFQINLWICVLLILLGAFVIVGALKLCPKRVQDFVFGSNEDDPSLNIVRIVLGGSMSMLPTRNFARSILIIFVLYCFVIENSYKGGLMYFMKTKVREPEVSTTSEMVEEDFTFFMYKSSSLFVSNLEKVMERSEILSADNFTRLLDQIVNPEFNGAFLTSEDHLAYRNIHDFPDRYYSHAREAICTNNLVIYFHKNSCLVHAVDDKIMHLVSSGIIQKWSTGFIDKNFLKHRSSNSAKALKLSHLLGAFQVLLIGLLISFVVLILEIVFKVSTEMIQ